MKKLLICLSIIGLINSNRAYPLQPSGKLNAVAQCRVNYLQRYNLWSHYGWVRCFYMHSVRPHYGEVLARRFNSDEATVNAWMNSPSHKGVIMGPYKFIGIAQQGGYTVVTVSQ